DAPKNVPKASCGMDAPGFKMVGWLKRKELAGRLLTLKQRRSSARLAEHPVTLSGNCYFLVKLSNAISVDLWRSLPKTASDPLFAWIGFFYY
ncbi:MAG: hypothetical protein LH618_09650, partial [Saprospiraceae bacterium]|nr:hypothetical protein [Saprospiraceae bacterium]